MRFQYTEKKVTLPENVHKYAEKKVMKLERFFGTDADALVTFSVEKNRNNVEITVHAAGTYFRASESTSDMSAYFVLFLLRFPRKRVDQLLHAAAEKARERHQISGAHRPGAAGHDLAQDPRVDPGPAGELRRRQLFSRHPRAEDRRSRLKRPHASPPIRPAAGSSSADRCCPPAFHTHASAPGPARASGPTAPAASGSPRRHAGRARQ